MSKPLVVVIPHQLGLAEAKRRLERGLVQLREAFGASVSAVEERWTDDHLDVSLKVLGQRVGAGLDVAEETVRLEVQLPWMLAALAEQARSLVEKQGTKLLVKR